MASNLFRPYFSFRFVVRYVINIHQGRRRAGLVKLRRGMDYNIQTVLMIYILNVSVDYLNMLRDCILHRTSNASVLWCQIFHWFSNYYCLTNFY